MDGLIWIFVAWLAVAIFSFYVFIHRRSTIPKVPTIQIDDDSSFTLETQHGFANDLLNWVLWGNSGTTLGMEQRLALSPVLAKFVLVSLNEAARRIDKEAAPIELQFDHMSRQSVDSEGIQLRSKESMFRNIHIQQNESPGNYLSIHTQLFYAQESADGGIMLNISASNDDQRTKSVQQDRVHMRKIPVKRGPSIKRHTVIIEQINGEVEIRLAFIAGELFVISCFKDRPTVQLRMTGTAKADEMLSYVKRCIISAVLNFSIGELLYPDTESTERASKARLSSEYRNLSFLHELYPSPQTPTQQKVSPRSMLPKFPIFVKDIRPEELASANRLKIQLVEIYGVNFEFDQQPFVCIELDEPNQRLLSVKADHQGHRPDGHKVYWDEHRASFEFSVSSASNELLFEVFFEEEQQAKLGSPNNIRERKFCGTAIQSLAELRQALQEQRQTIELRLQGRPFSYGERSRQSSQHQQQQEVYGVLVIKAFLYTYHEIERPSAPQPIERGVVEIVENCLQTRQPKSSSPFAYPGDQPPPLSPIKKHSTTGSESSSTIKRTKMRQKQHYIYNVTDDEGQSPSYDRQYAVGSSSSPDPYKTSTSLKQFEYQSTNNVNVEQQQSPRPVGAVRKTISDRNALFQYEPYEKTVVERKKSAPITKMSSSVTNTEQEKKMITKTETQPTQKQSVKDEVSNPNDFEQLFDKQKKLSEQKQQEQGGHPAMAIFEMPDKMKRLTVGNDPEEFERIARERDRKTEPKKRGRSFFEQVRARLAGPVRLLPGRDGKRAKSYDDNESRPMEEVAASTPTSRDQSQTRHIRQRKGSDHFEPMYNQQLFVNIENSIGGSAHQSTSNLIHSPKNVFENGQSQLVLELIGTEEEKPRYYSMPPEVQSEPAVIKLMQSGKKLHIYEGHIFVAVKPRGRVICALPSEDNMDVYKQQHFQHEYRGSGLARILEAQPS
uniref:C2 domain-containing protein n=1 Tax=Globodera rostochiensis TaxID=31243 RepID=A0A914I7F6_GLORO